MEKMHIHRHLAPLPCAGWRASLLVSFELINFARVDVLSRDGSRFFQQARQMQHFPHLIVEWYGQNGRDLPWRRTRDPYAIWISEIILQQTQVSQGRDYYLRFMSLFPTVEALARAPEDEVLRAWQGLGYYSRARNLQASARMILEMGSFPSTYERISLLKGVGPYTAAAVASLAFSEKVAAVDGNVLRVLSRYFLLEEPMDRPAGRKIVQRLSDEMIQEVDPSSYNQGVMDLGALVCRPQNPDCLSCPLLDHCQAFALKRQKLLPVKSQRASVRDRYLGFVMIRRPEGSFWVRRRAAEGIWKGLYELPAVESDAPLGKERLLETFLGKKHETALVVSETDLRHRLTHLQLHILILEVLVNDEDWQVPEKQGFLKTDLDSCTQLAFPRPLELFLERLRLRESLSGGRDR